MERNNMVSLRGVELGSGIPKICVPIVEEREEEILAAAAAIKKTPADLVEWRCDFYEGIHDRGRTELLLEELRRVLGEMPLIFTYRTKEEGGSAREAISAEEYRQILLHAVGTCLVDVVDMELHMGQELAEMILTVGRETGCRLLLSSHDFADTPSYDEMKCRYEKMESWGADILKLAVMPHNGQDLLRLLQVCHEVSRASTHPVIGISMGKIGLESRILGEAFGSAMTFGCLNKTSAPGQMEVHTLAQILAAIHQAH